MFGSVGEGVPGGGLVDEAGMLALAWGVSRPLSGQRCRSFLLSLAFVVPTAKPLEVHRSVIVTGFDVVALGTSRSAARPVMQERFAASACAGSDEGAALVPICWQASRTVRCLPRHCPPPLIPYALTPAPPGPMRAGVNAFARMPYKAEAPSLTRGATLGEYAVTSPVASDARLHPARRHAFDISDPVEAIPASPRPRC